jgi:lipopolysaccharide transport system ATP-binding protein
MPNIAISVENLSKSYQLGVIGTGTFYGDLKRWWARRHGQSDPSAKIGEADHGNRQVEVISALQDVSFTVERGQTLGIIGRNGAGKSTLLKILARITAPTSGIVRTKGRMASLLEVGTGFHPELTGRQNVFLNGAILGMTRADVQRKFDEIVDFSGVEQFIDTPVKRYSSGMYVRLAFAVAAHLEFEVLIVDEVLAVGDAEFQRKCLSKMSTVAKEGRTVLIVGHNMAAITRLCDETLWLEKGRLTMQGSATEVVSAYLASGAVLGGFKEWPEGLSESNVDEFGFYEASVMDANNQVASMLDIRKPYWINLKYVIQKKLPYCRVGFAIQADNGEIAFESYDSDDVNFSGPREPGSYSTRCKIPGNFLNARTYFISVYAGIPGIKYLAGAENALVVEVEHAPGAVGSHMPITQRNGAIRPQLEWQQEKSAHV